MPIGSDPSLSDLDLGPDAMGRVVGELAVQSRVVFAGLVGISRGLECILEALITIGAENKPHALECQLFTLPQQSPHGFPFNKALAEV